MADISESGSEWIPAPLIEVTIDNGQLLSASKGMTHIMTRILSIQTPAKVTLHAEAAPQILPADPHSASNSLLMLFDGANGSATFTDSSTTPKPITPHGSAKISTAQSRLGGSSLYLDGTAGAYLDAGTSFALNTGDFTIEAWIRIDDFPPVATTAYIVSRRSSSNGFFMPVSLTPTTIQPFWNAWADWRPCYGPPIPISTSWVHVAMCRQGSKNTVFTNGVAGDSVTQGPPNTTGTALLIGKDAGAVAVTHPMYIDELRITPSVARYTANFTPPASMTGNKIIRAPDKTAALFSIGCKNGLD